jgi:hypothetical protein
LKTAAAYEIDKVNTWVFLVVKDVFVNERTNFYVHVDEAVLKK